MSISSSPRFHRPSSPGLARGSVTGLAACREGVDGRDKTGHDGGLNFRLDAIGIGGRR